jgi:hypothetical protein
MRVSARAASCIAVWPPSLVPPLVAFFGELKPEQVDPIKDLIKAKAGGHCVCAAHGSAHARVTLLARSSICW